MNLVTDTAGYNAVQSSNHVLFKIEQLLSRYTESMAKQNLAVDMNGYSYGDLQKSGSKVRHSTTTNIFCIKGML